MQSASTLEKVKKLREITGVGFKDCKNAIDENNGDIEKSIEFLRKKGIAKANKRMERVAADGLVCISENDNNFSILEVNSETDFVAKNIEFIQFVESVSKIATQNNGEMKKILVSKMDNGKNVKDNLVSLISKIGEKISLRRSDFIKSDNLINFSYTHAAVKKNIGKIGVLISLKSTKNKSELLELGSHLSMHVAALAPIALDRHDFDEELIKKEKEIIVEELKNMGKKPEIIDKISIGKINKFINDNTLLNQEWVMEPKKKVKDIIKKIAGNGKIEVIKFIRFKVGEGV